MEAFPSETQKELLEQTIANLVRAYVEGSVEYLKIKINELAHIPPEEPKHEHESYFGLGLSEDHYFQKDLTMKQHFTSQAMMHLHQYFPYI